MQQYQYLYEFNKKYNIQFNILNYTKNELFIINNILSKNNLDNILDTNSSNILRYIGLIYYYKYNKIEGATKYYLMAINLNNSSAMYNYANLLKKENKIEEATKYYLMAIDLNNSSAMYNYANLLKKENKIEEAKKYYLMAINLNNSDSMINYANLLIKENKIEEAKKYYFMSIQLNNITAINNYLIIEESILKQYNDLINFTSEIAINHINKIKNNLDIIIYNNKLKYTSKIDYCNICLEDNKVNILLNCFCHYICKDCYINLYDKPCPYCKINMKIKIYSSCNI